jgi:CubicO group peptidase (beta-lactamase class C family)
MKSVKRPLHRSASLACLLGLISMASAPSTQAQGVAQPAVSTRAQTAAQPLSTAQIDALVERTLKTFDVPGISVAVVKDGQVVIAKGYGVRSLNNRQPMDARTLVGIASNSKAFTTAALAILVDEGKLKWDDRVTDFIPEFKLYNPYVTEEFTVRDLLTHRSGLGLGAGDLMFFPEGSDFTMQDVIRNLRYLKQASSFRSQFDYDNNLYIVAGEVVKRVSGMPWEDFVEQKIMKPLGMNDSAGSLKRLHNTANVVNPHVPVDGHVRAIIARPSEVINPAGGVYSNVQDMAKWVTMLLANGKYGQSGQHLLSEQALKEMWSPQTILPIGPGNYNSHFGAYGLGWFLNDAAGYKEISHTGGELGMVTQVTLVPELGLGIVVLTNQEQGWAFGAITDTIKDGYYGVAGTDRVQQNLDRKLARTGGADKVTAPIWAEVAAKTRSGEAARIDLQPYVGTYRDKWLGDVVIALKDKHLTFAVQRSPALTGEMFFYRGNTFIVKWNDRTLNADAFVNFSLDMNGKPSGITMKAISPATDFSFDFHDLDLKPVKM